MITPPIIQSACVAAVHNKTALMKQLILLLRAPFVSCWILLLCVNLSVYFRATADLCFVVNSSYVQGR